MNAKALWESFVTEKNLTHCKYEAWAFGVDADLLASLVMSGEKTATASAYPLYELENDPLPTVGEYSIILDSNENAVCIIQTTNVYVVPFCEVSELHAFKEGEGDKTLDYWRMVHEKFFSQCLDEIGLKFQPDMMVVCEEFAVVYRTKQIF